MQHVGRWLGVLWALTATSVSVAVAVASDAVTLSRVRPRPGTYEDTLMASGMARRFRIHVPSSYSHARELPVVVLLHDRGGDPRQIEYQSRFVSEAESSELILVVPWGEGEPRDWEGERDVPFLARMLEAVTARLAVDTRRLVLVGFGSGGTLALEAARQLDDQLAAVVAVAALPPRQSGGSMQRGSGRVALLLIAGTADSRVPFDDGSDRSQMALAARWAAWNGCQPVSRTEPVAGGGVGQFFPGCRDGLDVVVVGVPDGGHAWPGGRAIAGGDEPTPVPDANELIVDFLTRHPR